MTECRWIECPRTADGHGVCSTHRDRTYAAGRRATEGAPAHEVHRIIALRNRPPAPDRLDELEWLIDGGEWPPAAARRVGWEPKPALDMIRRHRRDGLHRKYMHGIAVEGTFTPPAAREGAAA